METLKLKCNNAMDNYKSAKNQQSKDAAKQAAVYLNMLEYDTNFRDDDLKLKEAIKTMDKLTPKYSGGKKSKKVRKSRRGRFPHKRKTKRRRRRRRTKN